MKTFLFVFGTRPEAIKVAPLIIRLKNNPNAKVLVCSTGQHREMLKPILQFFKIVPDFDLDIMKPNQTLADASSQIMIGLQKIISINNVDSIIVQGDTTSSFIGGLVAFYNKIEIIHIEAGLRSNNIYSPFPEEFNRKALSLVSTIHLAPTEDAKTNLIRENQNIKNVYVTGNTGIDTLLAVKNTINETPSLKNNIESNYSFLNNTKKLILVTLHRRESFKKNLKLVMNAILELSKERQDIEFLFPLHLNPEVRKVASEVFGEKPDNVWLTNPIEYVPFVYLMNRSHFIITDSGGIQEEAPSLGKPVIIARENTERPEAIKAGTSILAPLEKEAFIKCVIELIDNKVVYDRMAKSKNPFGDGKACELIESLIV